MVKNCFSSIYDGFIPDKRIRTRLEKTISDLILKGTSVVNKLVDTIAGYFCHPVLVINPISNAIYGISSAIFYNRDWDKKNKNERKYAQQPIEEK